MWLVFVEFPPGTLNVTVVLFLGNLDPEVDEKLLYDTFSAFGVILTTPKIQRDPETGNSKGFAFINYASFEASDAAIEAMNGTVSTVNRIALLVTNHYFIFRAVFVQQSHLYLLRIQEGLQGGETRLCSREAAGCPESSLPGRQTSPAVC